MCVGLVGQLFPARVIPGFVFLFSDLLSKGSMRNRIDHIYKIPRQSVAGLGLFILKLIKTL